MYTLIKKFKSIFICFLILCGAVLLTYLLVRIVHLQQHIIPVEEKEAESYIRRVSHRNRVKAIRDHFHNIVEDEVSIIEKETACSLCHTGLPHHKHKKMRALLNMHTFFLVCETCHIKPEGEEKIAYGWMDPEGKDVSDGHYGTSYHPLSGSLLRVNLSSRIGPYIHQNGQRRFLLKKTDSPLAQDYLRMKESLNEQEKDYVKKSFHKNINPVGSKCKQCHNEKSKLDFKGLGFSEKRRTDLENLLITGIVTKYETFYLPELFE